MMKLEFTGNSKQAVTNFTNRQQDGRMAKFTLKLLPDSEVNIFAFQKCSFSVCF